MPGRGRRLPARPACAGAGGGHDPAVLHARRWPALQARIEAAASELLRHLSLLFVPAGVGIVVAAASGKGHWLAIIASLVVSTLLTLAVTGYILHKLGPRD